MEVQHVSIETAKKENAQKLFEILSSSKQGLSNEEAAKRLELYGPNALVEKKVNPFLKFLGYFWGPIPWMIEVAAILCVAVRHWDDFTIIMVLLFFNAGIGFWQESKAANALDALKNQLALKARVLRDGQWREIGAAELTPGDIIRVRLGDIIPADVKLLDGDYLSVDQAALTGESLPVNKEPGDIAYSGSVAKQGEMVSLVISTGANTYFGKTAKLVEEREARFPLSESGAANRRLSYLFEPGAGGLLILVQLHRGTPVLELVQFALILTVASIPVAMPAVLSVTMAVGALALSKMKAIVSRLESIEEMAGIDILCSDKTGTLTQNKLTLGEPFCFDGKEKQEVVLAGALASKIEDQDAIDLAVIAGLPDQGILESYDQMNFKPFDPVHKRTEAAVKDPNGKTFTVTKGAPQIILDLCQLDPDVRAQADKAVDDFAAKGYRTLGVARTDEEGVWRFLGIIPLYDPPREDSADTIDKAKEHGIQVKMITGDNTAIARQISGQLGMGGNIQAADKLFKEGVDSAHLNAQATHQIEQADGFAQVFPEHKYGIVKALQATGHIVGMTGDGVNDAPALKQSDVGVAVSGATDAARAAASLVLTQSGLRSSSMRWRKREKYSKE